MRRLPILLAAVLFAGCDSGKKPAPPAPTPTVAIPDAPPGPPAGLLRGAVTYVGAPPQRKVLPVGTDAFCAAVCKDPVLSEDYLIGPKGEVANVLVFVKGPRLAAKTPAPAEAVPIDQVKCTFIPHVAVIRLGQPLKFLNGDATLHNVHGTSPQGLNPEFNFGLGNKGLEKDIHFKIPEIGYRIKCDVHGWMLAWVHILDHPFWALTGPDGKFEIRGLPQGEYEIETWHEKLKMRSAKVKLGPDGAVQDFVYKP